MREKVVQKLNLLTNQSNDAMSADDVIECPQCQLSATLSRAERFKSSTFKCIKLRTHHKINERKTQILKKNLKITKSA